MYIFFCVILPQPIAFDNSQMTNCAPPWGYNSTMKIVYIDSLFLLNLAADYLLCLAAARICALRLKRPRYFAAALLGAAYAAVSVLPGLGFLSQAYLKLPAGLIMGLIAYGAERSPLRCTAVFFGVSAAFGGGLWALSLASGGNGQAVLSMKSLLLSFALCYGAFRLIFRRRAALMEKRLVRVEAAFLGRQAEFTALWDTGNSLSDPTTGAPVMLACTHALKPLLGENTALFSMLQPIELLELCSGIPELQGRLRLIPYTAVGSEGLLPALRPDRVSVDGREEKGLLIAVSDSAAGDGFEAII